MLSFLKYAISIEKGGEPRIADFVHGSDGLGEIALPPPSGKKIERSASEFLVEKVNENPGEVSILALGPLTNLALVSKMHYLFFNFYFLQMIIH